MFNKKVSQLTDQYKYPLLRKNTFYRKQAQTQEQLKEKDQQEKLLNRNKEFFYRYVYTFKGVLGCIGGFMIHLVIGSLYQWGLLNPYITSYFKLNGYPDLTLKDTVVIFPIMMFCIGVTMKTGLQLGSKYGYTKVLIVNFAFCSGFVFASSFTQNILLFVTLYSLAFGLMAGLTFMVPMRICNDYFPNKQTYVNGFILIGTGLGSVVFGLFSINFVNPNQQNPIDGFYVDPSLQYIAQSVPDCIRYLSILYLIVGILGSIFLLPLQTFNKQQQEMQKTIISNTLIKRLKNDSGQCLSCKEAIMSKVFWVHVAIIILGSCGNLFINTNYKLYAKDYIQSDQFLTVVGLVGSVGNGVTRFFWSSLFNRIGYKLIMLLMLIINIICLATVRFSIQTQTVYLILVFIFNCTLGGMLVVAPTYSAVVFGKQIGAKIFGMFWCSFALGNFLQYVYLVTLQEYLTLNGIIYICLGMNVCNVIIIIIYTFHAKWNNDLKYFKFAILPGYQVIKNDEQLLIYSVISNRLKPQQISSYIQAQSLTKR